MISKQRTPQDSFLFRRLPSVFCTLASLALLAGPLAAHEQSPPPSEDATSEGETTATEAGAAGLWIFTDPETGEILERPTPEQLQRVRAFRTSFSKSDEGLEPFELEGGGSGLHLAKRFRHAMRVTLLEDGTLAYACDDHPGEILRLTQLSPAAPAAPAPQPAPER